MKPKALRHFLALAGSSLLAVSSTHAQTGTWNVDSNGTWGLNTNWASNTIADGAGFIANFTNDITADRTVSLDTDRTINRINFADSTTSTAGSWILDNNGTSTNNLILSGTTGAATGTVPVIDVAALGTGKNATISAVIEGRCWHPRPFRRQHLHRSHHARRVEWHHYRREQQRARQHSRRQPYEHYPQQW